MAIRTLLLRQDRGRARAVARRLARGVVMVGAALGAAALACERMGIDLPLLRMPAVGSGAGFREVLVGFVAVSLAGLVQAVLILALLLAAATAVRIGGPLFLRRGAPRTAEELGRLLSTDRFSAALEARGALAPLIERAALREPPPEDILLPGAPSRARRWITRAAVALLLLVALTPGTAPGGEGTAPVAGTPAGERGGPPLTLRLLGERRTYLPHEAVPVQVVAEAALPPAEDLDLPVRIAIDGGAERPTGRRLFLAAGAPAFDGLTVDLRTLAGPLEAGEHTAVAHAGDARSNVYVFRVEPPPGEDGGGGAPPPAGREEQPRPDGGGGQQPDWERRFVEPLVREGEKVNKLARVPIEVPGGAAPAERTLEEAWPELERRREAALNRPGLSPHARKLVREYFERLRPEGQ